MISLILANFFTFLSIPICAYATFKKERANLMFWQTVDSLSTCIGNIFAGSLTAAIVAGVSAFRNYMTSKDKNNVYINSGAIIFTIVMTFIFNSKGLIGLLPLIGNVTYSLVSYITKDTQKIRLSLLASYMCWTIHNFYFKLFLVATGGVVLSIITIVNLIRFSRKKEN